MNKALFIKNWNKGGNSYVLKGNPKNKWVGFQETVINHLTNTFEDFNIVIWTDKEDENDENKDSDEEEDEMENAHNEKEKKKHRKISKKKEKIESNLLKLNSNKAKKKLKWNTLLNFNETIKIVTDWYKNFYILKKNNLEFSKKQIIAYQKKIKLKI